MFVPQQEAWVVERMGKFHKILNPVSNQNDWDLEIENEKSFLIIINKNNNI